MSNLLTLGDLKTSELPGLIDLCPEDPRFIRRVNRAIEWLLTCGSFWGTTKNAHFCVDGSCIVLPGVVASLEGVRACHTPVRIENNWYRMLPGFNPGGWNNWNTIPDSWEGSDLWFEYLDNVPSFRTLCAPRILRSYISNLSDIGKTIKFLGEDKNKIWVRTMQNGVMQDGEVVVLDSPFADTVTEFTSVPVVLKSETADAVRVFSKPSVNDILTPFGIYQYWETRPTYQRYKIVGHKNLQRADCCPTDTVAAIVKVAFVPVKNDDDILAISNRPGIELAVMGVKALDDGDLARSDLLLFGNGKNQRLGAIPMLNNEIRTNSGDRFSTSVQVAGLSGFKCTMRGFV